MTNNNESNNTYDLEIMSGRDGYETYQVPVSKDTLGQVKTWLESNTSLTFGPGTRCRISRKDEDGRLQKFTAVDPDTSLLSGDILGFAEGDKTGGSNENEIESLWVSIR